LTGVDPQQRVLLPLNQKTEEKKTHLGGSYGKKVAGEEDTQTGRRVCKEVAKILSNFFVLGCRTEK